MTFPCALYRHFDELGTLLYRFADLKTWAIRHQQRLAAS